MRLSDFHDVLVVLSVRPALEEPMVDWLLAFRGDTGFSSVRVEEHNAYHDQLTAAEQVKGRQSRVQFQVRVQGQSVEELLAVARREFGTADIHYWILPLLDGGHLIESPVDPEERPMGSAIDERGQA